VWLVAYTYHGKAYQLLLNGVTGAISGRRPWSWIKITLAALAALLALYIFIQLQ
jgi:hypothetical protein